MPNLAGLILPTPNVSTGWGQTLNDDFTIIDNVFTAAGTGTSVGLQVGSGKTLNAGGTIIAGGTLILGSGDNTAAVTAPIIRGASIASGTLNTAGANLTISASNGTGTGGSGKIILQTAPVGVSGTTPNTMQTAMEIANTGVVSAPLGLTVGGVDIGTLLPVGTVLPYAGSSAPTNYLLCDGSAVSRTSYAALFAIVGTTYGIGDNSTTFNLPDLRGRIPAGKDDMGGTAASRLVNTRTVSVSTISRASTTCTVVTTAAHGLDTGNSITISGAGNVAFNGTWTVVSIISSTSFTFSTVSSGTIASVAGGTITVAIANGVNGATLGASGGLGTNTLTTGQMPLHGHPMRISPISRASVSSDTTGGFLLNNDNDANFAAFTGTPADPAGQQIGGEGGSGPHNNVQPTLVLNYIIRT